VIRGRDRAQKRALPEGMPVPERPARPFLVELATAVLVVGGLTSILSSVDVAMHLAEQGPGVEPLALLSIAIGLASVILGILVRFGRAWLVAINVVAVTGFLELTSLSGAGFLYGGLDVFVVLVLMIERPWFNWRPPTDADDRGLERP
jgi:hypothetical protein